MAETASGRLLEQVLAQQMLPQQVMPQQAPVRTMSAPDPLQANANYAQYLVDTVGEQQAFEELRRRRLQLPQGWVPDFERGMRISNQRRLQSVLDETRRSHQENEKIKREQATVAANKPKWKLTTDTEGREFYVDEYGRMPPRPVMLPNDQQSVKLKDLGSGELESVRENAQQLAQVVKALGMMRGETVEGQAGDPEATGWEGFVPEFILQRLPDALDSNKSVATRAQVGNVGSLRIKQRSGGAVPAAEMARLKPFIPNETDSSDTVRTKLSLFANEYAKMLEEDVGALRSANRRVPVALQNFVADRIKMARGVVGGRQADAALGGQPDPMEALKAIEAELARRRGASGSGSVAGVGR